MASSANMQRGEAFWWRIQTLDPVHHGIHLVWGGIPSHMQRLTCNQRMKNTSSTRRYIDGMGSTCKY